MDGLFLASMSAYACCARIENMNQPWITGSSYQNKNQVLIKVNVLSLKWWSDYSAQLGNHLRHLIFRNAWKKCKYTIMFLKRIHLVNSLGPSDAYMRH